MIQKWEYVQLYVKKSHASSVLSLRLSAKAPSPRLQTQTNIIDCRCNSHFCFKLMDNYSPLTKIKVKGQIVRPWECILTDRQMDRCYQYYHLPALLKLCGPLVQIEYYYIQQMHWIHCQVSLLWFSPNYFSLKYPHRCQKSLWNKIVTSYYCINTLAYMSKRRTLV